MSENSQSTAYRFITAIVFILIIVMYRDASPIIPSPDDRQTFSYGPLITPSISRFPFYAKPVGVGPVASGGNMLNIQVRIDQFFEPVDIYGAYTVSNDPGHVHVLNPDGSTFRTFTLSEIINTLANGTLPENAHPWKSNVLEQIDRQLFKTSVSTIPPGKYTIYLMATPAGNMNSYYIWRTGFSTQDVEGSFALDFSLAPADQGQVFIRNSDYHTLHEKEFTIEAWIKSKTSVLKGGIFSSLSPHGAVLFVNNNRPKFALKTLNCGINPTSTECMMEKPSGCTANPTSTECIVDSHFSLIQDVWHHIAGVLTGKEHIHPLSTSCTSEVMSETPHMDIYVNGEFQDCSSSGSQFVNNPYPYVFTIGTIGDSPFPLDQAEITATTRFDGVIDEVRVWTTARTQSQIQECMHQQLTFAGEENCVIDPGTLMGYWRLNEGEGFSVMDFSGNGLNGDIEYFDYDTNPPYSVWDGGWVEGYPFQSQE